MRHTPINIKIVENNFTGKVRRSIGSSRKRRYFVLRIPLMIRTKKGRMDMRVDARDTGPRARDCNCVIMPIGARTASAKTNMYKGPQLFRVVYLRFSLKL